MSWFGGSISSLTGQLSNLTKDILTEGTEEISDPTTELRLAKEKIEELHSLLTTQKSETERLKRINKDLEEKAESSELQINAISREYRGVLETREKEVNTLKRQHAELLEEQARSAVRAINNDDKQFSNSGHNAPQADSSGFGGDTNDGFSSYNYDGDVGDWDFGDSIRLQRENNRLRSDLQNATAEAKHWRSVAGQLGQKSESQDADSTNSTQILELQSKIQELESSLSKKSEQLQQQATSLHEHHRQKVATLKERHAKDVKSLQEKVHILEQHLSDASSGSQHSGTLPESERQNVSREGELERKLANALNDKDKALNARVHLEGVLEELQQEVERLQDLNERQQDGERRKEEVEALQTQLSELSQRMEKSEEEKNVLKAKLQSASHDAKNEMSVSLLASKDERDGVIAGLEELVSSLGDEDCQKKIGDLFNTIDKENMLLKEQKTKLEEQIILLEKTSANHMMEKQSLTESLAILKARMPLNNDELTSEDDDTLNTKFSTSNESDVSQNALRVKEEDVDAEVERLRSQLEQMKEENLNIQMERSDWSIEKEALEEVVTDLRKKSDDQEDEIESLKSSLTRESSQPTSDHQQSDPRVEELEAEMKSVREENHELEKALEELDSQHSQALAQLIGQRDKLASQISDQNAELDESRQEIDSLNSTIEQMKNGSNNDKQELQKKCQHYEQELAEWKKKSREVDTMEEKMKDLKDKLAKGGLVINDLHMDKQDLEQQLQTAQEEIRTKVVKLKESRCEKVELEKEKKELEEKLQDMEDRLVEAEVEVEKWEQLNEVKQTQSMDQHGKLEVDRECSRLRAQIESMEQEKETIKEEFQFLIDGNTELGEQRSSVKDSAFHHIFEEELKVRQKLLEEENMVGEMKEYVEKLRNERQGLKEKLAALNLEKQKSDSLLESAEKEKEMCEEKLAVKVTDLELEMSNVKTQLENVTKERDDLVTSFDNQEKYYNACLEEMKAGQDEGNERLELLQEMNSEMERLRSEVKDVSELRNSLFEKHKEVDSLSIDVERLETELKSEKMECSRHVELCEEKDEELEGLKEKMVGYEQDLRQMNVAIHQHQMEMEKKEAEMEELVLAKKQQEEELNQIQNHMDSVLSNQQQTSNQQLNSLREEIMELNKEKDAREKNMITISQLEVELASSRNKISGLEEEVNRAKEMNKNNSLAESSRQKSVIPDQSEMTEKKEDLLKTLQTKLDFILPLLNPTQMEEFHNVCDSSQSLTTLPENRNVEEIMERENSKPLLTSHSRSHSRDFDDVDGEVDRFVILEAEMEELRGKLSEKDNIVLDLQRSNASLLELLEKKADGDHSVENRLAVHKLEAELRSLRGEREQMVAVVSEKSRENSSLKSEIHRLMDTVSAGQTALQKAQQDNVTLDHHHRQSSPPRDAGDEDDEMKREALNNMARLVRDRDTEIEALTQKNNTLLAVLQESTESQAAEHLVPLLKEKEALSQQLSVMMSEREQLIAVVQQKHSESLAFHSEVQRLTVILVETQEAAEKVKAEYAALIPSFEGKTQALISTQQELVECKQKLSEMEIRHGELIQRSNSQQNASESTEAEVEKYKRLECDFKSMVVERDAQIQSLSQKLKTSEELSTSKESECLHLRKQLDNSKFQLTGLMAEIAEAKSERELVQQKSNTQNEESSSLRHNLSQMTLAIKDKDVEIMSLKDQISTLNSVLQNQKGEKEQVALVIRDHESAVAASRQLQQERDYNAMVAEQRQQECDAAKTELSALKDKVFKQGRELERLRSHLIEIEEGYTKEALEAEEREKHLRNKLAVAEEQLLTSSSHVQLASQESHRQIESLQEQLHHLASQRDSAYMQVATTQDQCQQYAASLSNLQLVLEHFQKEKDSAISMETEKYQDQAKALSSKVKELQDELEATRSDLTEALDGLDAASRLSEQLDRKEEAMMALKEEVLLREDALKTAEEEIAKLNSSTEAKVDKTLMHNMVLTWLTSPEKKRHEIVQLIGHVLDFSSDDFSKIESAHSQDNLWIGFFRQKTDGTTNKPNKGSQSFSQLFVKFLERESSPPPTPVKLPAEAMAAEAQLRHKTTFNPFTAPRHVTHGNETLGMSSGSSSHLLLPQDTPHPSPLFAPVTSVSNAGESAILKDVLSWNR